MHIYTRIQTNLTSWEAKDTGYVFNGSSFSTDITIYGNTRDYLYAFICFASYVFSFVSTIVILYILYSKAPKNPDSDNFKMWHSLFWTSVGVLTQFNVVLIITDLVQVGLWCSSSTSCGPAALFKVVWLFFNLMPTLLLLSCSIQKLCISVPFLEVNKDKLYLLFPPFISPCCFVFCHFKGSNRCAHFFFYFIALCTIYFSLSAVVFYSIPVVMLLVVYPIKVAAAYSFLIAALVLCILIAFYGEYKRVLLPNLKAADMIPPSLVYISFPLLNMLLIFVIMFFFVTVYSVLANGNSENSVFHAILSFLPSMLLSFLIWFFKNQYLNWLLKKKHEAEQEHSSQTCAATEITSQEQESQM